MLVWIDRKCVIPNDITWIQCLIPPYPSKQINLTESHFEVDYIDAYILFCFILESEDQWAYSLCSQAY